jgi:hypothetical protein
MRHRTLTTILTIIVLSISVRVGAQSLGDLARAERARRQTIKTPAKVYTNESLQPEPAPTAGAPPSTAMLPRPVEAPKDTTVKDESFWRQRMGSERAGLVRARILADALQSRINALTNDFAARDDPAQRNVLAAARQDALTELERMKQEIAAHEKAIAEIQEEARRAGVPAAWVR